MSRIERRASPDPRYYMRRSEPLGRPDLRRPTKVRGVARMKPQSWPSAFWFRSALFERGNGLRRVAFAKLMGRNPAPLIADLCGPMGRGR